MMASPSVLLPEPFGPIKACVSPCRIAKLTPCRIGLPSTDTWRFLITNVDCMSVRLPRDLLVTA